MIISRRERGESIREIATAIGISVGTLHGVLAESGNSCHMTC